MGELRNYKPKNKTMIGTVLSTLPSSPSLPVEEVRKVEQVVNLLDQEIIFKNTSNNTPPTTNSNTNSNTNINTNNANSNRNLHKENDFTPNKNILTQEEDDNVTHEKNVVTLQVNDSTNNNITNKNTQREDVLDYDTLTVTGDTIDTIAIIDIATIATTTTGGNGTIDDTIPSATIKSPMISAVIAALTTVATSNSKIRNVSNDNVESSDDGNHYRISRMDKDGINDDNHDTSSSNDTQNDN